MKNNQQIKAIITALFLGIAIAVIAGIFISQSLLKDAPSNEIPRYIEISNEGAIDVYSQAEFGSEKLGVLNNSAKFYEVTGGENGFYRINYGENLGWVSANDVRSYNPEFHEGGELPKYLRCYGEEPFWELTITDMKAEFYFFDAEPEFYDAENFQTHNKGEYEFGFSNGDILKIQDQLCQSTMVDNIFNWSVEFEGYAGVVQGCCTIQR